MNPATREGHQSAGKPDGVNKEKRPRGDSKGIKVEGISFAKSKERMPDLLVAAAFAVQCRGTATVFEVFEDFISPKGLNSKVKENTISDALEGLRKMDVLAEGQNADGQRVFSMKRVKFNCNPQISDVRQMVENLKSDTAGMLIIERFRGNDITQEKRAWPDEPADFEIDVVLLDAMTAGQVWNGNYLYQQLYFDAGKWFTLHQTNKDGTLKKDDKGNYIYKNEYVDHAERPLIFERTWDKKLMLTHPQALQNFFANNVSAFTPTKNEGFNRAIQVSNFFGLEAFTCDVPEHMLTIFKGPVIRDNPGPRESVGAGLYNYEAVKPGLKATLCFTCPTKNFILPKDFKFWLSRTLRRPIRGMSPSRGARFRGMVLKAMRYKLWSKWEGDMIEV